MQEFVYSSIYMQSNKHLRKTFQGVTETSRVIRWYQTTDAACEHAEQANMGSTWLNSSFATAAAKQTL